MSGTTRTTRRYSSELRSKQAARTREKVVSAARDLFEAEGFQATTITAIARTAGVSPQTVYAVFGSKAALMQAVVEQMEISAEAADWQRRIAVAEDPAEIMRLFAGWTAAFFTASGPTVAVAQEAAAELKGLMDQGDAHRRQALDSLLARPAVADALQEGLCHVTAVDRAWLLTGVHTYLGAVQGCGWTTEEFTDWLGETLIQQLLGDGHR